MNYNQHSLASYNLPTSMMQFIMNYLIYEGCEAAFRLPPKQGMYPWEHVFIGISVCFGTELMSVVFQSERM